MIVKNNSHFRIQAKKNTNQLLNVTKHKHVLRGLVLRSFSSLCLPSISISLSISLFVYMSICFTLSIYLSVYFYPVPLSLALSLSLYYSLSLFLSIYPAISLSKYIPNVNFMRVIIIPLADMQKYAQ